MNPLRRHILLAGAAGATLPFSARSGLRGPAGDSPSSSAFAGLFDAKSAPDAPSRQALLAEPASFVKKARHGVDIADSIHRNLSRQIDANFARLPARRLEAMLANWSDVELGVIAQAYVNSATDAGLGNLALDVAAIRLQPGTLARLASEFGFARVYESVVKHAPQKAGAFLAQPAVTSQTGVVPGTPAQFERVRARLGLPPQAGAFAGPTVDMTLSEIFTHFRTAPGGSLSIAGALYETGAFAGGRLTTAFGIGYTAGSIGVWMARNFAPSLWDGFVDSFGGWMYRLIELRDSGPAPDVTSPEEQYSVIADHLLNGVSERGPWRITSPIDFIDAVRLGGDYGVTHEIPMAYPPQPGLSPNPWMNN